MKNFKQLALVALTALPLSAGLAFAQTAPAAAHQPCQAAQTPAQAPKPCLPPDGAPHGEGRGHGPVIGAAIARSLGLSDQALRQELKSGKTVAELAKAKGVSLRSLHDAALSALQTQLAADVTAGKVAQARATELLTRAQADANFGLNMGRGHHGGHGQGKGGLVGQPGNQDAPASRP